MIQLLSHYDNLAISNTCGQNSYSVLNKEGQSAATAVMSELVSNQYNFVIANSLKIKETLMLTPSLYLLCNLVVCLCLEAVSLFFFKESRSCIYLAMRSLKLWLLRCLSEDSSRLFLIINALTESDKKADMA